MNGSVRAHWISTDMYTFLFQVHKVRMLSLISFNLKTLEQSTVAKSQVKRTTGLVCLIKGKQSVKRNMDLEYIKAAQLSLR